MKLLRFFRRKRRVYYWFGTDVWDGSAVGPFPRKLDAVLAGPYPMPDHMAYLSKEKV